MLSADEVAENAWMRSRAQCECRRAAHLHGERCGRDLVWEHRGQASRDGGWEAHRSGASTLAGWEAVKQVTILCWECYHGMPLQENPGACVCQRDRSSIGVGRRGRDAARTDTGRAAPSGV